MQLVIDHVIECAQKESDIVRIVLFGSRARQDFHDRSDYDFAIEAPLISDEKWARWSLEVQDSMPTLCGVDLIRLSEKTPKDLSERINKEGKIIYERK